MSASMLVAWARAPRWSDEPGDPDLVANADLIMSRLVGDRLERARELLTDEDEHMSRLPEEVQEALWDLDDPSDPAQAASVVTDEVVRSVVRGLVQEWMTSPTQEVALVRPPGSPWLLLTGGPSFGDDPTQAFAPLNMLDELGLADEPFQRP